MTSPRASVPGWSWLTATRNVPSGLTTMRRGEVTSRMSFWSGGGPISVSVNVTGVPGAKPVPWTANAKSAEASLRFTMHRSGPEAAWDGPHTVCGAAGGGGSGVLPELVSDAPRMTPPTTRAAPTETQPTQARCVRDPPPPTGARSRARPSGRDLGLGW